MILLKIFFTFFRIGLFAIGGAYSFLPLIQKEVVKNNQWLTNDEFLEVLGIVKMFPGAISIKFATYTGYKIAGIPGVIVANIGNFLSPVLIIIAATYLYSNFKEVPRIKNAFNLIQLVIFAMILAVAFQTISINQLTNLKSLIIIILAFSIFIYTNIHPAIIIMTAGLLGAFIIL